MLNCSTCKNELQNNITAHIKGTQICKTVIVEGEIQLGKPIFNREYKYCTFNCGICGEPVEADYETIKKLISEL